MYPRDNIYFLQDSGVEIDGIKFYGIAYNHLEALIPLGTDIVVTHVFWTVIQVLHLLIVL